MNITFVVDGTRIDNPLLYIRDDTTDLPELYHSVSLQNLTNTISLGNHNVTIAIWANNVLADVEECSLLVQTIIP